MNHKPTHSGADDFPNSPLPIQELGIWNWERGILRISPSRTRRRYRVASGTPYMDHRARTGRTDGPVEMT